MYCVLKKYFYLKNNKTVKILNNDKKLSIYNFKNNFNYIFDYSFFFNFLSKKTNFHFFFKHKGVYCYNFNKLNNFLIFNFYKSLNNFFFNNKKILFLDSDFSYSAPFYNFVFGVKNVSTNSNFFFLTKNNLTKNNFIHLYKIFIIRFKIEGIVVLDYSYFKKFFLSILKFNLPVFSFLKNNEFNIYLDYYFYCTDLNKNLIKIILYNNIISIFFYYYNIKFTFAKNLFIKKLYVLDNF